MHICSTMMSQQTGVCGEPKRAAVLPPVLLLLLLLPEYLRVTDIAHWFGDYNPAVVLTVAPDEEASCAQECTRRTNPACTLYTLVVPRPHPAGRVDTARPKLYPQISTCRQLGKALRAVRRSTKLPVIWEDSCQSFGRTASAGIATLLWQPNSCLVSRPDCTGCALLQVEKPRIKNRLMCTKMAAPSASQEC